MKTLQEYFGELDCYVVSIHKDGKPAYAVRSFIGSDISIFHNRDVAFACAKASDLEPHAVH